MLTSFGKLTELTGTHSWVDPSAWVLIQTRARALRPGRRPVLTGAAGEPAAREAATAPARTRQPQLGCIKEGNATMLRMTSLEETFAPDEVQQ